MLENCFEAGIKRTAGGGGGSEMTWREEKEGSDAPTVLVNS